MNEPRSTWATDAATSSRISSSADAISELALRGTSNTIPNRIATLQITSPITAQYGLINGGGANAYQYYIDPKFLNALKVIGEREIK